jgi:CheY-like chemotaxis protein
MDESKSTMAQPITRGISADMEVVGVRRAADTIKCISACKRLLRVLVVDDDGDTAWTLSTLVKRWGHEARVACSGTAVLEMISAYQPDVLLLDTAMPGMDGCRLAQQLRRQSAFKDTLLIAITGYADESHRAHCQKAGFDLHLIKPVDPSIVETLLLLEKDRTAESLQVPS